MTNQHTTPAPDQPDPHSRQYPLSEAAKTAALAATAPHLKEAALRLAIALTDLAQPPHYTVRASWATLQRKTGLVPSALGRAIKQLCDPTSGLVSIRRGGSAHENAYQLSFLQTVRGTSFGEAPPKEAPSQEALPFEKQPTSLAEGAPAENTPLAAAAARVEISTASLRVIDHVFSAKPKNFATDVLAHFRTWLHGYMAKFGRDENNQPLPNGSTIPPKEEIVAQFLAISTPSRLATMLDVLALDQKTCYSYAWFITVGLERIHGIAWTETRKVRAALQEVKRQARHPARATQQTLDPAWTNNLIRDTARKAKALP
jgi:hypothetical protein